MHSAPASAVTLGRDSKITPITPSGVRTRSICSPLGRSHSAMMVPTGSGSSAMVVTASMMPSMRASVSSSRSRKAAEMPLAWAVAMSFALAARIFLRCALMAPAAVSRAVRFCSGLAMASALAPMRALRPISAMMAVSSVVLSAWLMAILLGAYQHQIVTMDQGGAIAGAQQFKHGIAVLAHHQPGLFAIQRGKATGDFDAIGIVDADGVAATRSEEHTSELQSRPHLVCR